MIGKTISHYKILSKLGEGGMGVVYKAEDTRLKRFVALKFLPQTLTLDALAKERFIQEAQAASALEHPNICNIHEINETEDGQMYIVMACYEGQTLKEKLAQGPLSITDTIDIAEQIAKGLAKAHGKGIIHRDIKPANILITEEGIVKILDFGLAKLAGQSLHTKTGSTMGTVAYMSPEQAQGLAVDHRTDIWSLGVVLYEMLTGQLPFRGQYEAAIIYSVINQEQEPAQKYQPELCSELLQVLNRALEKEFNRRYQTINDFLIDLGYAKEVVLRLAQKARKFPKTNSASSSESPIIIKRFFVPVFVILLIVVAAGVYYGFFNRISEPSEQISLAVADFENKTSEKELDGLSDLLITALTQSRRLHVMTRTRMLDIIKQMKLQGINKIDEEISQKICRQAKVEVLLCCSVRKLGTHLYIIDLKAFDIVNDRYMHANRVQGDGQESIPQMIDQLAAALRKNLRETNKEIEKTNIKVASFTTTNLEAHSHYFLGIQLYDKTKYDNAINEFEKAVKLDSTFGLAYFRLGYSKSNFSNTEEFSIEPLKKALELDLPEREEFLARAAIIKIKAGWQSGVSVLQQMRKRFPDDKEMMYRIGDWYFHAGLFDSAAVYFEQVVRMDPSFIRALDHINLTYEELQCYDKEFEAAKLWMSIESSLSSCYHFAKAAFLSDNSEQGIAALDQIRMISPQNYFATVLIAIIYAHQGKYNKAETELNSLIAHEYPIEARIYGYYYLMGIYAYSGQYRLAIDAGEKAKNLYWQAADTTSAILATTNQALLRIWSRSSKNSFDEINKFSRFLNKNGNAMNNLCLGLSHYYSGKDNAVESVVGQTKYPIVKYLNQLINLRRNCTLADSINNDKKWREFDNRFQVQIFYLLAESYCKLKEFDKAIQLLDKLRTKWCIFCERPVFIAKSYILQAEIYEKKGDRVKAMASYEKLLDMWKMADPDLPDLIEAKTNLARLKGGF